MRVGNAEELAAIMSGSALPSVLFSQMQRLRMTPVALIILRASDPGCYVRVAGSVKHGFAGQRLAWFGPLSLGIALAHPADP